MATRNDYEIAEQAVMRELYRFYIPGSSAFDFRYTSGDSDYEDASSNPPSVYKAVPITRSKIKSAPSSVTNNIVVNIGADVDMTKALLRSDPVGAIYVEMSVVYDDTLGAITDKQNLIFWKGRLTDRKLSGAKFSVTCKGAFSFLERLALRRRATMHCPYALFSEAQCKVSKSGAARQGVVTSRPDPVTVVIEEDALGSLFGQVPLTSIYDYSTHYNGGYITFIDVATGVENLVGVASMTYNGVVSGTKSNVTIILDRPTTNLEVGMQLLAYPGCSRQVNHCHNKFKNYYNFGGIPHLSTDNPFTSPFRTPLN